MFDWLSVPVVDANGFLRFELQVHDGRNLVVPDAEVSGYWFSNVSIYPWRTGNAIAQPMFSIFPQGFRANSDDQILAEVYVYETKGRTLRVRAKVHEGAIGNKVCIWTGGRTTGGYLLGCGKIKSE